MKNKKYKKGFATAILIVIAMAVVWAQNSYSLAEGSRVWVDGTSTLKNWTAEVQTFDGTIVTDADGHVQEVSFTFDVKSMEGGRGPDMNGKIYNALKSDDFPKITFQGKGTSPEVGDVGATGLVSLAGKEKEVLVEASGDISSGHITGQTKLKLSDFDIEPPSAMFGAIVCHDELVLHFDLNLTKKSQ
ncbi:MAG: YceI family protein [Saprospiraceae bacterium]|nr:YceI family protein [Saprospiraceae bacterium]